MYNEKNPDQHFNLECRLALVSGHWKLYLRHGDPIVSFPQWALFFFSVACSYSHFVISLISRFSFIFPTYHAIEAICFFHLFLSSLFQHHTSLLCFGFYFLA